MILYPDFKSFTICEKCDIMCDFCVYVVVGMLIFRTSNAKIWVGNLGCRSIPRDFDKSGHKDKEN